MGGGGAVRRGRRGGWRRRGGPLGHDGIASGRRRYCGDACRARAWRRRHQLSPCAVVVPVTTPRRGATVYECPACEARLVGQQRCEDCGCFARRAGMGGWCPHCDEAVTLAELVGDGLIVEDGRAR